MESESVFSGDVADGAEVSPLADIQPSETSAEVEDDATNDGADFVTGEEAGVYVHLLF